MDARQEARRLYQEESLTPSQIAERLGVSQSTVRSWKSRDKWDDATQRNATTQQRPHEQARPAAMEIPLTDAQELFCQLYVRNFNASMAYQKSHPDCSYQTAMVQGWTALRNHKIRERVMQLKEAKFASILASVDDLVEKHMRIAFADISGYVTWGYDGMENQVAATPSELVDGAAVKSVSKSDKGFKIELHDPQKSLDWLASHFLANPMDRHKIDCDNRRLALEDKKLSQESGQGEDEPIIYDVEDQIIPKLMSVLQDNHHAHIIITSGRAATKSSYAGIQTVDTIVNQGNGSVVVLRKFHNKIRKTVYRETLRAITRLTIPKQKFKITVSPFEIRFNKTGNTIYFTGNDSIDDTKGMIDETRPIKLVVLDEVTEFFDSGDGEDELLNIEATFARGNDESFQMVYLFNPPKNPNAPIMGWLEKMKQRPDVLHVHVDYRDVPESWLGKKLLESAEQLKQSDPKMYNWLWLGQCIGIDELIYYMFADRHVQLPPVDKNDKPLVPDIVAIGVDYGQQNATTFQAFGLYSSLKRLAGLGEYHHSGRDSGHQRSPSEYAQDFAKFVQQIEKEYGCTVQYTFIDPSAKGLAEEIKRAIPRIIIRDAQNSVALGISRVQKALTFDVMTIHPGQKHLKREFGLYSYDRKSIERGKEEPIKENDHGLDATRYCVMGLWKQLRHFLPYDDKEE